MAVVENMSLFRYLTSVKSVNCGFEKRFFILNTCKFSIVPTKNITKISVNRHLNSYEVYSF